jgi:CheY-like chemotaxis protein
MDNYIYYKKPVIVVVDDETDVLSSIVKSLENNYLDNVFEIIDFKNPLNAIEYAKKLKENNDKILNFKKNNLKITEDLGIQDISLLLTDMIMPEIKGEELIKIYKEIFPSISSAILTAYADKNSAINAINFGNVQAYFEKPWQNNSKFFFSKIKEILSENISKTDNDISFIFRDLKGNINDYEAYFEARRNIWLEQGWDRERKRFYDIDEYDFYSKMLCGFEQRIMQNSFVGGMRITSSKQNPLLYGKKEIIENFMNKNKIKFRNKDKTEHKFNIKTEVIAEYKIDELFPQTTLKLLKNKKISIEKLLSCFEKPKFEIDFETQKIIEYNTEEKEQIALLPAMKVHNKKGELKKFIDSVIEKDSSRVFWEIGKLCIQPKYRGNYKGNEIFQRLQEEMFASFIYDATNKNDKRYYNDLSDVLICCNPRDYRGYYKKFGFNEVLGLNIEEYFKGAPSMCYHIDAKKLGNQDLNNLKNHPLLKRTPMLFQKLKLNASGLNQQYQQCSCNNLDKCMKDEEYLKPFNEELDEINCPFRIKKYIENS